MCDVDTEPCLCTKQPCKWQMAEGYFFGAEACHSKFRQLKHRFVLVLAFLLELGQLEVICYDWVSIISYKTIVDYNKKPGNGASSWVFFSSMVDLLADEPSVDTV